MLSLSGRFLALLVLRRCKPLGMGDFLLYLPRLDMAQSLFERT